MANKYSLQEDTPANTDDALEGPQRIREIKQAYNERISRDHLIGGSVYTTGDVLAQGGDSYDSGYHRRVTIKEETATDVAASADSRLNASGTGINHSTTNKMAEIWVEKNTNTSDETSIRFTGTESPATPRTVVTTTQTQTLTNKTLTEPVLTDATLSGGSGSIDGVDIGQRAASTGPTVLAGAAAGKFTTLESTGNTIIGAADTDTLTLKAETPGLSSDATGGFTGANQFYAGIVGEIRMFGGTTLPGGWLWCNGGEYIRVDYAELFASIGLTYSDIVGAGGNKITTSGYFRVPDLAGRIPIGSGTGKQTGLDADSVDSNHGPTELDTELLTARTLGDYGADETHTLTAGESGAGPHYHKTVPDAHTHGTATFTSYAPDQFTTRNGIENVSFASDGSTTGWRADPVYDATSVASTITASGDLTTETETEANGIIREGTDPANAATFRINKTDLSRAVKAEDAHTQMQPFVVINYIIKY